ncbi:hypothetical protein [Faucicola atlantae]|uniref:Uncharacterized protein n=1 Tax=Faucicola atlantae TaxID=34059 RepID=A0A1B8QI08_9GAMM|nr:hypothetical protein [Moraxella atlantae]OBX83100.1 hypothetical protein A9306_05610 [Moraxella atlantae]
MTNIDPSQANQDSSTSLNPASQVQPSDLQQAVDDVSPADLVQNLDSDASNDARQAAEQAGQPLSGGAHAQNLRGNEETPFVDDALRTDK